MTDRTTLFLISTAILVMLTTAACSDRVSGDAEPVPDLAVSTHEAVSIDWAEDWDAAFVAARADDKPVMAVFYADWCIWCKRLDNTTLADARVAKLISDSVIPVRLDIDRAGKALSRENRVQGPPTIIFFGADGAEIGRIPGYLPPDGFAQRARMFL